MGWEVSGNQMKSECRSRLDALVRRLVSFYLDVSRPVLGHPLRFRTENISKRVQYQNS